MLHLRRLINCRERDTHIHIEDVVVGSCVAFVLRWTMAAFETDRSLMNGSFVLESPCEPMTQSIVVKWKASEITKRWLIYDQSQR